MKTEKSFSSEFFYPVIGAEVNSFSEVEALVEPTVVSSGESDDKLSCTLVCAIDLVMGTARKEKT